MSTLLDSINEQLTIIIEIIPVNPVDTATLYYSTRANTITVDGVFVTVYPYITQTLNVSNSCVLPFAKGEIIQRPKIDGFQLMYNIGVTYNVPAYYGATVNCYVGSNQLNRLEDYLKFFTGFVSNVKLDVNNSYITIDSNKMNLQKNVLEEFDNKVVPALAGRSDRFGAVPVRVNDEIYHVLAGHPCTVYGVYDKLDNPISYTLIPFLDWTVIKCDEPTDSTIRIDASNGEGAIGDLLKILIEGSGFTVDDGDIAIINSLASEYTSLQLFEQVTYEELITTIIHSLTYVWYFDLLTGVIRLKPFYRAEPAFTLTDNFIVSTLNTMAYRKRPYTDFEIIYDIDFSTGLYKSYKLEHPHKGNYDLSQHKKYPVVYSLTRNDTVAQTYLQGIMNHYGSGLGVLELETNLYSKLPFVGDTINIDSKFLKLENKTFFVEKVTYKFTTMTVAMSLITI